MHEAAVARVRSSVTIVELLRRMGIDQPERCERIATAAIGLPDTVGDTAPQSLEIRPDIPERSWQTSDGALGGDVIDLVRAVTGAGLAEALALLTLGGAIATVGDETDALQPDRASSAEPPVVVRTPPARLLSLNEATWSFYTDDAAAARARVRLVDWGIIAPGLERLEGHIGRPTAGHTPLSPTGLVDHLQLAGFHGDEIVDAGWAVRPGGVHLIDRYRNRVMLPFTSIGRTSAHRRICGVSATAVSWAPGAHHVRTVDHPRTAVFDAAAAAYLPLAGTRPAETVVITASAVDALAVAAAACAAGAAQQFTAMHVPAAVPARSTAPTVAAQGANVVIVRGGRASVQPDAEGWRERMEGLDRPVTAMCLPGGFGALDWLRAEGTHGILALGSLKTRSHHTARDIRHHRTRP